METPGRPHLNQAIKASVPQWWMRSDAMTTQKHHFCDFPAKDVRTQEETLNSPLPGHQDASCKDQPCARLFL